MVWTERKGEGRKERIGRMYQIADLDLETGAIGVEAAVVFTFGDAGVEDLLSEVALVSYVPPRRAGGQLKNGIWTHIDHI